MCESAEDFCLEKDWNLILPSLISNSRQIKITSEYALLESANLIWSRPFVAFLGRKSGHFRFPPLPPELLFALCCKSRGYFGFQSFAVFLLWSAEGSSCNSEKKRIKIQINYDRCNVQKGWMKYKNKVKRNKYTKGTNRKQAQKGPLGGYPSHLLHCPVTFMWSLEYVS